ncbi:hypothetical protein LTR62_006768 [Meristemomyces frigidus]|uniref:Uncharacterized protein n=1 Tax=Meristemomyces frigidus TaxID=1508187 RepID=A0AAN7YJ50_9PEZI|nr:hypothetical protein LTR62_006768 [Meristemomyces frigidus]
MSLPVPQISGPTIRKFGSTSSLGNSAVEHEHDLNPVTATSRRSSVSSVTPAGLASPTLVRPATTHSHSQTVLYAGRSHKPTTFDTQLLKSKSPFFQKLLSETPEPLPEQTTFEDADEAAMALFGHWIAGKKLGGPTDFHSCGHYLGLYMLSQKSGCEALANDAAWRALYDNSDSNTHTGHANGAGTEHDNNLSAPDHGLSDAMKEVLTKDTTMSLDFMQALIEFGRDGGSDGKSDPREGLKCTWHIHEMTKKCVEEGLQPWEKD